MVVGLLTLELFLPEAQSLKGKRSIMRPLIEHVRRNWNVSVTEVDHRDAWQRATLAVASVNTETAQLHHTLEEIAKRVEGQRSAQLLDYSVQIF